VQKHIPALFFVPCDLRPFDPQKWVSRAHGGTFHFYVKFGDPSNMVSRYCADKQTNTWTLVTLPQRLPSLWLMNTPLIRIVVYQALKLVNDHLLTITSHCISHIFVKYDASFLTNIKQAMPKKITIWKQVLLSIFIDLLCFSHTGRLTHL